ncbi:hypothetical protein H4582DRAFT_235694 [Lactarius indigo]|nr:hypothetical protein H4582DRAFT_235694 [Lactarius indigo]
MRLDELAAHEGNGVARWFSEVDVLAKELAKFIWAEAAFLTHCVPSLYLHLKSLSFFDTFGPYSQAKVRANERAHALMLNPTGLRELRLFLSTFFCAIVARWAFHIFIPRHSASLFILHPRLICLSSIALQRLHPHRHYPLQSRSHLLILITASRFHILRPPPLIHCYFVVLRFRSPPMRSDFRMISHFPRVRMSESTAEYWLSVLGS